MEWYRLEFLANGFWVEWQERNSNYERPASHYLTADEVRNAVADIKENGLECRTYRINIVPVSPEEI